MKKLGLILIFSLALRLISIDQSFWLDEATSGIVVRDLTFSEILTKFSPGDFHPPLYYLILKMWSVFFGVGETALRSLSILAGVLGVYVLYLISQELRFKNKYIAPLLLATSGLHIYYSGEARMYALASLFVSLSIYFFMKTVKPKEGRVGDWMFFGVFMFLSIATHYLTIFILPAFWGWAIYKRFSKTWWKKFLASHIILIIFGLLWLPFLIQQLSGGLNVNTSSPLWGEILGKTSFKQLLLIPIKFSLGRISFDSDLLYGIVAVLVLGLVGFLLIKARKSEEIKLIWVWLTLPLILGGLLGLFVPVFNYFRFLFVLPAFYLLLSRGMANSKYPKVFLLVVLFVNLSSSFYYLSSRKFQREDWRGLSSFVEAQRAENSQVLFPANTQMEGYLYYFPEAQITGPVGFNPEASEVWYVKYVAEIFDPDGKLVEKLRAAGFNRINEYNFNGILLEKYER